MPENLHNITNATDEPERQANAEANRPEHARRADRIHEDLSHVLPLPTLKPCISEKNSSTPTPATA